LRVCGYFFFFRIAQMDGLRDVKDLVLAGLGSGSNRVVDSTVIPWRWLLGGGGEGGALGCFCGAGPIAPIGYTTDPRPDFPLTCPVILVAESLQSWVVGWRPVVIGNALRRPRRRRWVPEPCFTPISPTIVVMAPAGPVPGVHSRALLARKWGCSDGHFLIASVSPRFPLLGHPGCQVCLALPAPNNPQRPPGPPVQNRLNGLVFHSTARLARAARSLAVDRPCCRLFARVRKTLQPVPRPPPPGRLDPGAHFFFFFFFFFFFRQPGKFH